MVFLKAITGRNFTMKGLHHGFFPANFEKFLRFLPKHPQANAYVPFMRFYHCSQNSYNISITLRQLLLRSSKKAATIWHSKQTKTLCNQWFGAVLWNSLSEKKMNILDIGFYAINLKILIRNTPESDGVYWNSNGLIAENRYLSF